MNTMYRWLALVVVLCVSMVCQAEKVALLVNGGGGQGMDTNSFAFSDEIGNWYRQLLGSGYSAENIYVMDAGGLTNDISYFTSPMEKPRFANPFTTETRNFDSLFSFIDYTGGPTEAAQLEVTCGDEEEIFRTLGTLKAYRPCGL